jgi:hypothetical protein
MNEKYYVIAGTRNEFEVFRNNKCIELSRGGKTLSLSNFVYVALPIQLKGISSPHGWFIGTWRDRDNIKDIVNTLCVCYDSGLPDTLLDIITETLV